MMINPPTFVKGLTVLNRDLYRLVLQVPAARVLASKVGLLRGALDRNLILTLPRIKTVVNDAVDPQKRLLLLNPDILTVSKDSSQQPQEFSSKLSTADLQPFKAFDAEAVSDYEVVLDYDYWNTDEILSATLPDGMDVPGSFETIGHIAHLNLRAEHEPFKHLIGQVILDKNPVIRTVVNKVGAIEATFRFFQMELLAGEDEMVVHVREEGCTFTFDYSKVYWNSRLQHEHRRLVESFKKGEKVCDLFCGVGPFAIPAAKKGCIVYANDLNPESIKYLDINREKNKLSFKTLLTFNSDARDFVMRSHELLNKEASSSGEEQFFQHYIMNLPASAHEFLDAFEPLRLKLNALSTAIPEIRVHCYVFCRSDSSPIELVEKELNLNLGFEGGSVEAHYVRNVAPNKDMFCVSFKLPPLEEVYKKAKLDEQFN